MESVSYIRQREKLTAYFDRTASAAWAALTSDEKVSWIRATVRQGRDEMRATLLSYLPGDLTGQRVLDAGCGTGALAVEAARRGATVVAIDVAGSLVSVARERLPAIEGPGTVEFQVADMLEPSLGRFDWVVAMDSLIHYRAADMVEMLARLAGRAERGVVFTFAPRTAVLTVMHLAGKLFPRGDRSPEIEPVGASGLRRRLAAHPGLAGLQVGRTSRVSRGFYISQAQELVRP